MKRKLERFAEIETFKHVFEKGCPLKGDWHTDFFKNENPLVLELGCGRGEYTIGMAKAFPEKNFIGIDIKGARLWRGAKTVQEEQLANVAFLRIQIESLTQYFDKDEVSEIWITFPDPQSAQRRTRKRLTSIRFLKYYRDIVRPGGMVHLKTDDEPLHQFSLEELPLVGARILQSSKDIYIDLTDNESSLTKIQTTYEKIFLKKGKKINYLQFDFDPNFEFPLVTVFDTEENEEEVEEEIKQQDIK